MPSSPTTFSRAHARQAWTICDARGAAVCRTTSDLRLTRPRGSHCPSLIPRDPRLGMSAHCPTPSRSRHAMGPVPGRPRHAHPFLSRTRDRVPTPLATVTAMGPGAGPQAVRGCSLEDGSPRAGGTSMAAALAGTARLSHRPAPDRCLSSPRSRRSAPRVPRPGSALPDPRGRQPSGSRTACRQLPRTRAPCRGRRVEEVPGSKASLLALDEQPALASENEELRPIRLGVVDAALARLEDGHVDPELRELHRRVAVLVRGTSTPSPSVSEVNHSASRTLVTNQPSVTGASPEPASQAALRSRSRFSQSRRRLSRCASDASMFVKSAWAACSSSR